MEIANVFAWGATLLPPRSIFDVRLGLKMAIEGGEEGKIDFAFPSKSQFWHRYHSFIFPSSYKSCNQKTR